MENYFEKRIDPTKLVPGAKTVVVLMQNYFPEKIVFRNDIKYDPFTRCLRLPFMGSEENLMEKHGLATHIVEPFSSVGTYFT